MQQFDTAAGAEAAGFRACLRCRPYRSPLTVNWSGPELVCRAVQLILDGALDDGSEAALGRRVGMSPRHLRRLFLEHLGATPDQLARSRRVHFARRLLDDTDLTITQIAFASGFGSTRQLNRACHEVFRASPRALRGRRRAGDLLTADGGLTLRLPFDGQLDFESMLGYLGRRAIPGVEHVDVHGYRRTIAVDGDAGVLELFRGGDDHLLLRVHLPHWQGLIHVVSRSRRIFSLDAPPDAAVADLRADPVIGDAIARRPGLRVPGTWDAFEIGIRAIVGQQVSVRAATTVIGRIVQRYGAPVAGVDHLGLSHLFPAPADLAAADVETCGLPSARARTIRQFAAAVEGGGVQLDRGMQLDELVAGLTAIDGVGAWTAHYIALRLGEHDAFPVGDLGLRRAALTLSDVPLKVLAERWRPRRALAAAQLWMLDGDSASPRGGSADLPTGPTGT